MGWITVETPNAIYKLILTIHVGKNPIPSEKMDGIILEFGGEVNELLDSRVWRKMYANAVNKSKEGTPIYYGDQPVASAKRLLAGIVAKPAAMMTIGGNAGAGLFLIHVGATFSLAGGNEEMTVRKKAIPLLHVSGKLFDSKVVVDQRNALVAEKAEKVIAPRLAEKVKRKPVIGIVYGAGHYGIVRLLHEPGTRRRILRTINRNRASPNAARIDEITFNPTNKQWVVRPFGEITIPKRKSLGSKIRARAKWIGMRTRKIVGRKRG